MDVTYLIHTRHYEAGPTPGSNDLKRDITYEGKNKAFDLGKDIVDKFGGNDYLFVNTGMKRSESSARAIAEGTGKKYNSTIVDMLATYATEVISGERLDKFGYGKPGDVLSEMAKDFLEEKIPKEYSPLVENTFKAYFRFLSQVASGKFKANRIITSVHGPSDRGHLLALAHYVDIDTKNKILTYLKSSGASDKGEISSIYKIKNGDIYLIIGKEELKIEKSIVNDISREYNYLLHKKQKKHSKKKYPKKDGKDSKRNRK
jgi:hypothetical protein